MRISDWSSDVCSSDLDEVKLTASIAKLCEEDPSLVLEHNGDTNEMLLRGQGEIHLKLAVERLKSRFNVEVDAARPQTGYKETIRKATKQHSRFKRQTGGDRKSTRLNSSH